MKIIIVGDHQIVRDGISVLLMRHKNIEIIGEAANGDELLNMLKSVEPDILVLDISMPKITGIELTRIITKNI